MQRERDEVFDGGSRYEAIICVGLLRRNMKQQTNYKILTVSIIILMIAGLWYWSVYEALRAEANVRYTGLQNLMAAQVSKTVKGMEISANNVFNEVERHLDSPQSVVDALKRESKLNQDVRGYFAAFELNYFKETGKWFEPYVHHSDTSDYEMTQVGSAQHDYTKSIWYIRAKGTEAPLWSEPYYYYDGTDISGHYCTYVKSLHNDKGELACVCGADITFRWLETQMARLDSLYKNSQQLNQYPLMRDLDFFSVILYKDGTCLACSGDERVEIKQPSVIHNLSNRHGGVADLSVNGVSSVLYYGPIDGLDWSVGIIVPKNDLQKPFLYTALALAALAVLGILLSIWLIRRRA